MNNLILCSNNNEVLMVTIPVTMNDTNILTNQIQLSNKIEQIRVLYESNTQSILSIKMENSETKIYQFNKKDSAIEWEHHELNIQIKSNGFYSIITEKSLVGQQILEASASEQKLNFYVSNINEQTLSNTRSYSIELPENMGGIEYIAYSIVKSTQLVTLRMQDGSLLVIKLTDSG
ncbi:unnamed protein product, partial [Rotaria magnacalcarata]